MDPIPQLLKLDFEDETTLKHKLVRLKPKKHPWSYFFTTFFLYFYQVAVFCHSVSYCIICETLKQMVKLKEKLLAK